MTPLFYTAAAGVLAGLILLAMLRLLDRSKANLCVAAFLALAIPSPMMLVAHSVAGIAMAGLAAACLIPAIIFAEEHDDEDWRGGGGDRDPAPVEPTPDPGFDPNLWGDFERDFWAHVERAGELVHG